MLTLFEVVCIFRGMFSTIQHLRWKLLTNFTKSPILDFAGSWICLDIYQDIFQEKMAILERLILLLVIHGCTEWWLWHQNYYLQVEKANKCGHMLACNIKRQFLAACKWLMIEYHEMESSALLNDQIILIPLLSHFEQMWSKMEY